MAWILRRDSSHYLFKWRGLSLQVFEHPTFFMQYELLYQLCLERIKYVYSFALNIGTYIPDVDVKRSLFVYILLKSILLAWWYHRLQNVSLILARTTLEQGDLYLATMLKAEFFL